MGNFFRRTANCEGSASARLRKVGSSKDPIHKSNLNKEKSEASTISNGAHNSKRNQSFAGGAFDITNNTGISVNDPIRSTVAYFPWKLKLER